jgi:hypothetical protein
MLLSVCWQIVDFSRLLCFGLKLRQASCELFLFEDGNPLFERLDLGVGRWRVGGRRSRGNGDYDGVGLTCRDSAFEQQDPNEKSADQSARDDRSFTDVHGRLIELDTSWGATSAHLLDNEV